MRLNQLAHRLTHGSLTCWLGHGDDPRCAAVIDPANLHENNFPSYVAADHVLGFREHQVQGVWFITPVAMWLRNTNGWPKEDS